MICCTELDRIIFLSSSLPNHLPLLDPLPAPPYRNVNPLSQRVLVENIPGGEPPPQVESSDLAFLIKLKLLGHRPERGVLENRGLALHAKKTGHSPRNVALTASQKTEVLRAPLDLVRVSCW